MVDVAKLDRQILSQVFKNPQAIRAFESLQKTTTDNIGDIAVALQTAIAAGAAASAANAVANTANAAASAAGTAAANASIAANAASLSATDASDASINAMAALNGVSALSFQLASDLSDIEQQPKLNVGTLALQNDDYVSVGQFGANGKDPQSSATLTAAATDLPTVIALANSIRAALIACGIGQ
jgi:hypothetical protein